MWIPEDGQFAMPRNIVSERKGPGDDHRKEAKQCFEIAIGQLSRFLITIRPGLSSLKVDLLKCQS